MSERQATLSGDTVEMPTCRAGLCDRDATTLYELRGVTADETVRCDEHEPYWQGPGGIENTVELTTQVVADRSLHTASERPEEDAA